MGINVTGFYHDHQYHYFLIRALERYLQKPNKKNQGKKERKRNTLPIGYKLILPLTEEIKQITTIEKLKSNNSTKYLESKME